MHPRQFKTQDVILRDDEGDPEFFQNVQVIGYGEPYKRFDLIMTHKGVMFVNRIAQDEGGVRHIKTETCRRVDEAIWPNGIPKQDQTLFMLKGPSGCGKSTFARNLLAADSRLMRVNRDELRKMSFGKWTDTKEQYIISLEMAAATAAFDLGYNILIDDTNLTSQSEELWRMVADKLGFLFKVIDVYHDFAMSFSHCLANDNLRTGSARIGRPAIERQFLLGQYVEWGLRPVVFVDLDGTLADLSHREHLATASNRVPFFEQCKNDTPVDIVARWVRTLAYHYTVCIVSGRPADIAGDLSITWLKEHKVPFHHIFMRQGHDYRHDVDVKNDILRDVLASGLPKEQIAFAIDDRLSVVNRVWRANGIRVIPVCCRDYDLE